MHVEHRKWYSPNLGQEMDLKTYGHAGKPIMVFPSSRGRYFDYEDRKMVEAIAGSIDSGKVRLICVDGRDTESWMNKGAHPHHMVSRYNAYEKYITDEVMPFVRHQTGHRKAFTTGCSMGAYHAANQFFRHPELFDGVIALSGLYHVRRFVDEYMDEHVYNHAPLAFLPNLNDPWYLEQYRQSTIIFCVGQGRWEEPMLHDIWEMENILASKGVPAWIDRWGHNVDHDWPWWTQQIPYFVDRLPV
jgi:esterase/lipase superfamily enzyme